MGSLSVWHWLIFLAIALLAFGGKGKISSIMGDVADGIKSFKKGMADDAPKPGEPPKAVEPPKPIDVHAGKPLETANSSTKTG